MSYPITQTIGSAGGTITGSDGFQYVVPANAFSTNTSVTVDQTTAPTLSGVTVVSRVYIIRTIGTTLARDATAFVPYDSAYESQRSSISVYRCDDPTEPNPNGWTVTTRDASQSGLMGGVLSAQTCVIAWI
jgi:hypothetical protein